MTATIQSPLPEGTIKLKVVVRNYKGTAPNQIFGVVIEGIEHLDIEGHGTVVVVGDFIIDKGIKVVDEVNFSDYMSRDVLLRKL